MRSLRLYCIVFSLAVGGCSDDAMSGDRRRPTQSEFDPTLDASRRDGQGGASGASGRGAGTATGTGATGTATAGSSSGTGGTSPTTSSSAASGGGALATGGASTGDGAGGGTSGGAGIGGGGAAGGGTAAGGSAVDDAGSGCPTTQKSCDGRCIIPNVSVGCALTGCDPCPNAPVHAFGKCTDNQCDFDCLSGYERLGASCVPRQVGQGGAGGAGGVGTAGSTGSGTAGSGGGGVVCGGSQCGGCIPVIQFACCKPNDSCGCMWPFATCE